MYSSESSTLSIFLGGSEGFRVVDALLEEAEGTFIKPKPDEVKDWMKRYDEAIKKAYDEGYKVAKDAGYPESQAHFRIDCDVHFARLAAKQKRQQHAFEFGDTIYDNGIKKAQDSFHQALDDLEKAYEVQCALSCTAAYNAACDAGFEGSKYEFEAMCEAKSINETKAIDEASHTK
jgi:hypothetical protein